MPKWKIYNQDVIEWADSYSKEKFHALLCDPPYHLTTITKRFGKKDSAPAKYGTDGVFARSSAGFMGQSWDGGDVAFDPETWRAFANVLYPGAFIMAFSSSRTWHRLAVAIEDAGFILHPTLFLWAYGSGFPKATRVKGHEEFDGHRYGLQALKPAVEPIIVAQLPYDGKPVENITATGAGALNIDGGKIGTDTITQHGRNETYSQSMSGKNYAQDAGTNEHQGRWPSNFLLTEETAPILDEQSGILTSGKVLPHYMAKESENIAMSGKNYARPVGQAHGDSGGASRFFYTVSNKLDEADPVLYKAKAGRKERDAGLDELPELSADRITNTSGRDIGRKLFCQICGHRQGACKCDEPEWGRQKQGIIRNGHPTVKPIDLSRYLATLLLPPDEYAPRRIVVPFSGVASEMIGAGLAGWEQIVGIEFDTENNYIDIAEARLEHWLKT